MFVGLIAKEQDVAEQFVRIADLIEVAAIRRLDAPALVVTADRVPIVYRELVRLVDDLARQLRQAGLAAGDRVLLRAGSNAEFVIALLAGSRANLIVVPLDPALPASELRARSEAVGAAVVLSDSDAHPGGGESMLRWWPVAVTLPGDDGRPSVYLDAATEPYPVTATPEGLRHDDAMIMFTGGTTGLPKMVPWSHANIASSVRAIIAGYQLGPQDATVAVMPLYHGHGLICSLLSTLASGGTLLLPARGRFSASAFWDDMDAVWATWYTAVPTIHQILLERAAVEPFRRERVTLRFIRSCSAPLTSEAAEALQAKFSAPVVCAFGMTEATHQVATTGIVEYENAAVAPGLVGRSSGVEIRIAGPDGSPLPPGTVGEVWLRGSTVVRGYLGDPQITAANFVDGWLRTGDLGSLSTECELTIHGRIKELINRGGEKISPERIEAVLSSHPNVVEAGVFGVPHRIYGETVAAVIVPRGAAATTEDLVEFCRDRLAAFEIPAEFQLAETLPHTAKGSLDRRAVAEQFGSGPGAKGHWP